MRRIILLRLSMAVYGLLMLASGLVAMLFPEAITSLGGNGTTNVFLLGSWGWLTALIGLGVFLANRNPIRHILWLRLAIAHLTVSLAYVLFHYATGTVSLGVIAVDVIVSVVFGGLFIALFPRGPRFVRANARAPEGLLYTDADDGGLFLRRPDGTYTAYYIPLNQPATEDEPSGDSAPATPGRVLVVGNGAREHAIAWALRKSPALSQLWIAPGNGGTPAIADNLPIPAHDVPAIVRAAQELNVDLVIVGPEEPLSLGLTDALRDVGIPTVGPSKAAARVESSKVFAKEIMDRAGAPTAAWRHFDDYTEAAEYVRGHALPVVIKADGLAAGKGVAVCATHEEALTFLHASLVDGVFGDAGRRVVVEETLVGQEASAFAFCHGEQMVITVAACDYKRIHDGDEGPNTGGMGAYSPPEFVGDDFLELVRAQVFEPTLRQMSADGTPYTGILYAGLMVTPDGIKVLEFNCRLGDPETQVVLPRMESDFLTLAHATATGALSDVALTWTTQPAVGVVLASGGYPGAYETGLEITGLDAVDEDVLVFHSGTRPDDNGGRLVTAGGRVLTVVATGATMAEARDRAYANAARIRFDGVQMRGDVALRAVPIDPTVAASIDTSPALSPEGSE